MLTIMTANRTYSPAVQAESSRCHGESDSCRAMPSRSEWQSPPCCSIARQFGHPLKQRVGHPSHPDAVSPQPQDPPLPCR